MGDWDPNKAIGLGGGWSVNVVGERGFTVYVYIYICVCVCENEVSDYTYTCCIIYVVLILYKIHIVYSI